MSVHLVVNLLFHPSDADFDRVELIAQHRLDPAHGVVDAALAPELVAGPFLIFASSSECRVVRLQQAHAVLEPLKNATVRATGGSNSVDKGQQLWRMAEAGLKAKYGVLKGGGYLRTLRVMAQTLPDDSVAVQRLVERAWFDPDIAEYLLANKVRDLSGDASNKHVRRLIAGSAASQESD